MKKDYFIMVFLNLLMSMPCGGMTMPDQGKAWKLAPQTLSNFRSPTNLRS